MKISDIILTLKQNSMKTIVIATEKITGLKVVLTCDHNCSKCPDWWYCINLSDKAR